MLSVCVCVCRCGMDFRDPGACMNCSSVLDKSNNDFFSFYFLLLL